VKITKFSGGYTGKMRENSPTRIYIFKIFPGVIPRTPVNKGRGQGRGGEGMKPLCDRIAFSMLIKSQADLAVNSEMVENESVACTEHKLETFIGLSTENAIDA
jgi:hypothetical protein